MYDFIQDQNKQTRLKSLWRSPAIIRNINSNEMMIDGKKYINFSSNDYLGFSHHPQVVQAGIAALNEYGSGGRSSRLISGTIDLHTELEDKLAKFKHTEAALLFPTGFMANLGVISALLGAGDAILVDRLNHASLLDATKLAKCRVFVYDHCSVESLQKVLTRTESYKKRLVVTDSVFSMDGDFAPLPQIADLCRQHKVWLMIDDAHATGIFGEQGIGLAEHFGLLGKVEIVMGTLSKALGSQGGFVCGSQDFIDYLVNKARTFIFTTALSPVSCAAAGKAIDLVAAEPERRKRLLHISKRLRQELNKQFPAHVHAQEEDSQIIPFHMEQVEQALALAQFLKDHQIYAPAIRPPTVPKDKCRIRFSLTCEHTDQDLDELVQVLGKWQSLRSAE